MIGAHLKTFFLDKSRVVNQDQRERNFNIFYLIQSVDRGFNFQFKDHNFHYLCEGSIMEWKNQENAKKWDSFVHALNVLDFPKKTQEEMFHILAAILDLGNLNFQRCEGQSSNSDRESCLISEVGNLENLLKILSMEPTAIESMSKWMCHKRISSNVDDALQPMNVVEALRARDALAKFLYSELFNFIIAKINSSLRSPCHVQSIIGVLDPWGFERLGRNSFEQLCINFADEKIQQFFLESTFVLEQEEYVMEGIDWSPITFQNNSMNVELFDGKHGILTLIDEGALGLSYSSASGTGNLLSRYKKTGLVRKSENNGSNFTVRHFMRDVQYDIGTFVEKNQCVFIREQLKVLKNSKNDVLRKLVMDKMLKSKTLDDKKTKVSLHRRSSLTSRPNKKTIISDFRSYLSSLLSSIKKTTPHFVRCIQTNDEERAFSINASRLVEQVQALNISDVMKISSLGYFYQRTYEDFYQRYHCLCKFELIKKNDFVNMSKIILTSHLQINGDEESGRFAFGKTKVFLDEVATGHLEEARSKLRHRASVLIQARARRLLQQRHYNRLRSSAVQLQRRVRQVLEKRHRKQRLSRAAVIIQSRVRGFLERRRLLKERESLIQMRRERELNQAATLIQSSIRGFLAKRASQKRLRDIVVVQACVRRFLATLRAQKEKASRATRFEMLNRNLERQIEQAQNKIDFLMEKYFYTNEFETTKVTVDNRACAETKNKLLNEILSEKIQVLKDFFKLHPQGYDNAESQGDYPREDPDRFKRQNFHACRRMYLKQYEFFESVMRDEYNLECYQPLLHSYRKFDQRAEGMMKKFGLDETDLQCFRKSHEPQPLEQSNSADKSKDVVIEKHGSGGIFQFSEEDIDWIMTQLSNDVTPSSVPADSRKGPAQVLFMCLRHCDTLGDCNLGMNLIKKYLSHVKSTVTSCKDFDTSVFWLANTHQLLNYMKQFSKINTVDHLLYQEVNTSLQDRSSLCNIDLSTSWEALSETGQWLIEKVVKQMKDKIHALIVPAILENEDIQDLHKFQPHVSDVETDSSAVIQLVKELDNFNKIFTRCHAHKRMKIQIFKQVFDFINTICLNDIMTQACSVIPQFCSNLKGTFIRSNLRCIEHWAVNNHITGAIEAFDPISQAARLIQMQPVSEASSKSSIDWICKCYSKLNTYQIIKIMVLCRSKNRNEAKTSYDVLNELRDELLEREQMEDTVLIDDEKYPVNLDFECSQVSFDSIEIPEIFKLDKLKNCGV
ncbi:hypothetical protein QAD02_008545 [Eretmocerus hayati]|uniref:Uncharacterized protein n=1 Tax=Eretmocerus hayati TaxID=131215 RepID=A0ACC2N7E3_9HYME|nr:hypothetical protein QAD02_008545 [Eretmocerus hayati]